MSTIRFSGLATGMDTQSMVKELMKVEQMKVDRIKKQQTKLEWKKDVWADVNTKLYDFYKKEVFDLRNTSTFLQKEATLTNSDIVNIKPTLDAPEGIHEITVNSLAKNASLIGNPITLAGTSTPATKDAKASEIFDASAFGADKKLSLQISFDKTPTNIEVNETDTLEDIIKNIQKATDEDVSISFDENSSRIIMTSVGIKDSSSIVIGVDSSDPVNADGNSDKIKAGLGLLSPASQMASQQAEIEYKGVTFNYNSNDIKINGLDITLKKVGTTSATVTKDTSGVYDKVKNFVNKYNELLAEINLKVGAKSAKGYEPLTSEEKKAMSDDEVKLWEKKIKDSLLRRDDTLTDLSNSMRSILSTTPSGTTLGEYKSLSDIGITTSKNWREKGILHIHGDEDDSEYGMGENKLKKAIEENPEDLTKLLTGLSDKLYDTLKTKMKSSTISSALTFYNDKSMDSKLDDYKEKIRVMEVRLTDIENRYYKQFTAMEKAIQKMNSQSASFTSMMGGGGGY